MQATQNITGRRNDRKATATKRPNYHEARLADHIATALALIIGFAPYYLDTLHFRTRRYITDEERDTLKALAGDAVFPEGKNGRWDRHGLIVHQPSPDALRYIQRHFPDHKTVRFDVAIDFLTRTIEDANALRDLLWRIVIMQWHGKRKTYLYKGLTLYFALPWQGRNFGIYSAEFSKIDPTKLQPNAHFELKYSRQAVCEAHGIRKAANFIGWVLYPHVERELKLAVIDWDKGGLSVAKLAREEEPKDNRSVDHGSRVRRFKRRVCAAIAGDGSIPEWGEYLENYGVQRCLDVLPVLKPVALKTGLAPIINVDHSQIPIYLIEKT